MAVGRAERWADRRPRAIAVFGDDGATLRAASQVLALLEMAWHDCYAEITPSEDVVDDVFVCSGGTLAGLVDAAHLAVTDWRDLKVVASRIRRGGGVVE